MTVSKVCKFCGNVESHDYTENELKNYKHGMPIAEAMPTRNSFEREFMVSGLCFSCQSETFHKPMPGEHCGKELGECPECGCSIYENDGSDGVYKCATCFAKLKEKDGVLVECDFDDKLRKAASFD